jgi:predicted transcriptional regulator
MAFGSGKKITVRLDDDLVEGLQEFADKERVPVSQVIRHLVLRFLRPPPAVPAGNIQAGAPGGDKGRFPLETAEARRIALSDKAERENRVFREKCLTLFDGFQSQGLDAKEAAKRTNFALKEKKHPWATYEIVADVLRKEGRFRKVRRQGGD